MAILSISDDDLRLKKTVLLRTIECEVSEGSVSEAILENLELVEELDSRGGAVATDSMKAAYCAVALECTAKLLVPAGKPEGKYFNALKRIWRGKVGSMERLGKSQLLTAELKECWDHVEAAITNPSVCEKLSSMNTRNNALKLVWVFVREAWALMGPPLVQSAARLTADKEAMPGLGDGGRNANEEPEMDAGRENGVEMPEPVASKLASPGGGLSLKGQSDLTAKLKEQAELQKLGDDQVCDEVMDVGDNSTDLNINNALDSDVEEINREKVVLRIKHVAFRKRHRRPFRISSDNEDSETDATEVKKVQEAHKSSSLELPTVVTDPIPGALRVAKTVVSDLTTNNVNNECPSEVDKVQEALKARSLELSAVVTDPIPGALRVAKTVVSDLTTKNVIHDSPLENQSGTEANATNPSVDKSTELAQSSDANLGNPSPNHQSNVSRPNLMARNGTAHTYEWNDSIDASPETMVTPKSRLHLPSPKRKSVSPLKKREPTKFSRRRKARRWTLLEEETLRNGVDKFGRGNWKVILNSYREIFEERTEVDLKDKWRNMTK